MGREPGREPARDPGPGTGSLSSFLKGKWIRPSMDLVGFLGMFGSLFRLKMAMIASFPHMIDAGANKVSSDKPRPTYNRDLCLVVTA